MDVISLAHTDVHDERVHVQAYTTSAYVDVNAQTHARTHSNRRNYLSNARCDFLGVNEVINIRGEGGVG